ncbi:MAG: hypothetical protein AMJ90_02725 [candidate division Zixibacteria bacterium SM23_73_2]|nr:MAG: hypothetical protein AMJ90_02725 [candidate division Zixibacteria bacterium SM23_73_2]
MIEKEKATEILERGLKLSQADQTELVLLEEDTKLTRFAENVIHQNVAKYDHTLFARAVLGKKVGVAVTNGIEEDDLKKVVGDAVEIAKNLEDDPDFESLPTSPDAEKVSGFYENTSTFSPEDRAFWVAEIVKKCKEKKILATGALEITNQGLTVTNSLGIRQYFEGTEAYLSLTSSKNSQSGWAQGLSRDVNEIDLDNITETAIEKTLRSEDPMELPPGEYTVILEEAAVASLLLFLGFLGFGAKTFIQGRSFMAGKIGERITGDNITITEDPFLTQMPGIPFDYEGVAKKKVTLIEDGIARGVVYNSYYANKADQKSTGHALLPNNPYGPYPKNMVIKPGNSSMEEMIKSTERGILVTRFWYINFLNPMRTQITGTTQDGTFLIENGSIKSAVKNMRMGHSILEAFSNVEMMSRKRKVCPQFGVVMYIPAMKINKFNFIE